jgi:hypothetical protein
MSTWFRRYYLDPQPVARALAADILREYGMPLARVETVQLLRTRYMRLVAEYGLPSRACNDVADRAWALIAQAVNMPQEPAGKEFSFYT